MKPNPFRAHGVVTGQFFTNRAKELDRILATLREPGAKLLVYGPRRMGKTSTLVQAIKRLEQEGETAFLVDLSTGSTLVDLANRILEAASHALGRRWKEVVNDFISRLGVSVTLTPDPTSQMILPSLEFGLRSAPVENQRRSLAATLDTIDALAKDRGVTLGVVLDEFQKIRKFGGDDAEWHLRGCIQHHHNVSYVLTGSEGHIIQRMLDKGRALYGLMDQLAFGPIDAEHLARWIDDRMTHAGVEAVGVGWRAVGLAGPRTHDIVQVARRCFDITRASGAALPKDVDLALDDVTAEQESLLYSKWIGLTAIQQNVLRAVAANTDGLTTRATLDRFGLPSTGSTANTAAALVANEVLQRKDTKTGYDFDSPFFRRWVEVNTLPDIGMVPSPLGTNSES